MLDIEKNLTWTDLRMQYRTGRSYTVSGSGKNRIIGYRSGVMCKAGDLEIKHWSTLVKALIAREQEQTIYDKLMFFLQNVDYVRRTAEEKEVYVLSLYVDRIFNNPRWCYYEDFRQF